MMHTDDKQERPELPKQPVGTQTPATDNPQQPASDPRQDDEPAAGDYVVMGSGLGIDE